MGTKCTQYSKIWKFYCSVIQRLNKVGNWHNITFCRVRLMFIPSRLSIQPNTISLEGSAFIVAGSSKAYLGLRVKCHTFVADCNQISSSSTDFNENLEYQFSRKSVQWKPSWYTRTGWLPTRLEGKRRFSRANSRKNIKNMLIYKLKWNEVRVTVTVSVIRNRILCSRNTDFMGSDRNSCSLFLKAPFVAVIKYGMR